MKENKQFNTILSSLEAKGIDINRAEIIREKEDTALKTVFLKIVSVIGGLIGMGMFIGFLVLAFGRDLENGSIFLVLGLATMTACYFVNKSKESAIKDGVAVSFYISGFAMLIAASLQIDDLGYSFIYFIAIGVASMSLFLFKNQIIAFIATIVIIIGCHALLYENMGREYINLFFLVLLLVVVALFCRESVLRSRSLWCNDNYQPILVAAFCYCLGLSIVTSTEVFIPYYASESIVLTYIVKAIFILVTLGSLYFLLSKMLINNIIFKVVSVGITAIFLYLLGFDYPAFIVGFLFIIWSYNNHFKMGIALSICTFIWAMGMYYYDLSISLLSKSISLMLSGVVFLSVYWLIHKNWKRDEKE